MAQCGSRSRKPEVDPVMDYLKLRYLLSTTLLPARAAGERPLNVA
jgi:hypothetical protein